MKSGHLIPRFHGGKKPLCSQEYSAFCLSFFNTNKNKLYWAWGFLEYTGLPDALWSLAFCTRAYVAGVLSPSDAHVGRGVGTSKMSAFLGGSSTERGGGGKSPGRHPVVIALHLPRGGRRTARSTTRFRGATGPP